MSRSIAHDWTEAATESGAGCRSEAGQDQWFSECLALTSDWFWTVDRDLRTVEISACGDRKTSGTTKHELWAGIVDLEFDPAGRIALEREMREHRPFRNCVFRQTRRDGRQRFIKLSGLPVFDPGGVFAGYRGVSSDVTLEFAAIERQKALAEEQRVLLGWFREAIDRVGHAVVVFDKDGRLLVCNKYYRETFSAGDRILPAHIQLEGRTYRELMQLRVHYKLHKEFADEPEKFVEDRMRKFFEGGDSTVHLANGTIIRAQYRSLPDGTRVYVGTDITEIVAGEQKRRELEAQLYHSQKLESLGTLAGGIAHDLNNSLVPIMALTKLVARHLPEGSPQRSQLEIVIEASKRARDLVGQILAFSRKEVTTRQEFDLAEVVREAMTMLRAIVPATIKFDLKIAEVPNVTGDPGQWHQVLMNLASNAMKAIELEPGQLTVELAPHDDGLRLVVADTGCGMDAETSYRVFEPFFTTRKVGEGTGLGLSIVHGIVTSHGGRIELESEVGRGTRFIISLPAAEASSAPVAARA
jgi:signal transduction histidine kinase/PAS domain-containing protein